MGNLKKILTLFLSGLFFAAVTLAAAELISHFFLPKPTVHRLPMVKFAADPDCGYRLSPNQRAYTLGSPATINQWGFRGKNWSVDKPAGTVRIAILGSSYAFGHGVGDDDMYSAQLEKMLNESSAAKTLRYEVMSFGLGGYDTGHEINVLKSYALKFKPDIVVLSFFFNDMFYIKDYGFYPEMFRQQEARFSRFQWEIRNLMRHSRLAMFLWDYIKERQGAHEPGEVNAAINAYIREGVIPPGGPQSEGWKLITERLKEFKNLSITHGFKPLIIVIPTHQEMLEKKLNVSYVPYLKNIGSEIGIPTLVALDSLKETGKDLHYYLIPYDFHLSPVGHQIIAELLKETIVSPAREAVSS